MTDKAVWYLAGPMTGLPRFNFPAFDQSAATLRYLGYEVISPSETNDPAIREAALASPDGTHQQHVHGHSWGDILAEDVKLIADRCTGVMFLPDWQRSRGARLEAFVGLLCGHRFAATDWTGAVRRLRGDEVLAGILEGFSEI